MREQKDEFVASLKSEFSRMSEEFASELRSERKAFVQEEIQEVWDGRRKAQAP